MLTEADAEQASMILDTYPYFVPARYITAALSHREYPFAPNTVADMQLFKGNWLLYYQYLQAAATPKYAQEQGIQEEMTDDFENDSFNVLPSFSFNDDNSDTNDEDVAHEQQDETSYIVENISFDDEQITTESGDTLILPIYTEDYFLHQGVQVSNDIPDDVEDINDGDTTTAGVEDEEDKSLMVMMSFAEWLNHFKTKTQREKEEKEDQKALKTMWQKEKLAGVLEEENEEIPENVFEMAVNSITKEEDLISEPLIEIYVKQGKYDKAIDMYRKLSLRNPQKNAYFARKIEEILKEKES